MKKITLIYSGGSDSYTLLNNALSKRINSPNFYNNAPEDVINKENERLDQQNKRISQMEEILKSIK